MIGTMTPFRVSFAGGGSDLSSFYRQTPGCVISTTIDKHMYVFIHPSFDEQIQVKYSKTELVDKIEEIEHPIIREALRIFNLTGIDISSIADIPSGTGLGSSSSFCVGLFHALYGYIGQETSPEGLAIDACRMEIDILKEPIGRQDQYAASYGGLNLISFYEDDSVLVEPVKVPLEKLKELDDNLLMFYSGGSRDARGILSDQSINLDRKKRDNLVKMTDLARELRGSLERGSIDDTGPILDVGWQLKKSLSTKISPGRIDKFYEIGMQNGALGGKLLGAGSSGFLMFYCKKQEQDRLRSALRELKETSFHLDENGSRIILSDCV
jgi:D-glycero-alpha-D-manno-heptose-7-phosphate kinase